MEMKVNQFAGSHIDVPMTFGLVAVACGETHRGHSPFCAIQDRKATTAGNCVKREYNNVESWMVLKGNNYNYFKCL